ncbi:MAG: divalent metal cation transporter [bacterium]|nr:divalent metal cation transporter [bacterium]
MKRILAILLGSVIAAAFLGPGTVTTAARAGAAHGYQLLWTLVFATVACLVLQEASARLTVVSGRNLGEALRWRFRGGAGGIFILWLVLGAIVVGCAAYEAGNILGGVAGAGLATGLSPWVLTLISAAVAGVLLWLGSTRVVVTVLGGLVAIMGGAFLVTAVLLRPPLPEVCAGLLVPRVPESSGLLVLGLIGTTVVPYNLFLGSGIVRGHRLGEVRFGLAVAIGIGGLISMGVLVVGSAVAGTFSYQAVAATLSDRLGGWADLLFAMGLFAAGFSSAVTAPLAAAITARSLFAASPDGASADGAVPEEARWGDRSLRYRAVWLGVLAVGTIFGVADVPPIPVIILAQALNGVLLPVVAVFLLVAVNDRRVVGEAGLNGWVSNLLMSVAVAVTVLLGLRSFAGALAGTIGKTFDERWVILASGIVVVLLAVPVARWLWAGRRRASSDTLT